MTDSNPFVLPGMGQNSELSGNPLLASMEMMRQAWRGWPVRADWARACR